MYSVSANEGSCRYFEGVWIPGATGSHGSVKIDPSRSVGFLRVQSLCMLPSCIDTCIDTSVTLDYQSLERVLRRCEVER